MPPCGQEDWVALCQCLREAITTLECNVMCETLGGVASRAGLKQAGERVKYLYKTEPEKFFSGNDEDKAAVLREVSEQERHLQAWTVDSAQPRQLCCKKQREHRLSSAHGNVVFLGELFEW